MRRRTVTLGWFRGRPRWFALHDRTLLYGEAVLLHSPASAPRRSRHWKTTPVVDWTGIRQDRRGLAGDETRGRRSCVPTAGRWVGQGNLGQRNQENGCVLTRSFKGTIGSQASIGRGLGKMDKARPYDDRWAVPLWHPCNQNVACRNMVPGIESGGDQARWAWPIQRCHGQGSHCPAVGRREEHGSEAAGECGDSIRCRRTTAAGPNGHAGRSARVSPGEVPTPSVASWLSCQDNDTRPRTV